MMEIVAIAAVALVAWFAAGTIWNIRRGRMLMQWMQSGLPVLGGRTTVRWLGSSAIEMVIRDGKAPFASATLVVFLEPRDVPWMWALSRGRGRRDTLIIRGVLRRLPKFEVEALDVASWSGREALRRVPAEWLVRQAAKASDVVVHYGSADGARSCRYTADEGPARRPHSEASVRAPHRAAFPDSRSSPRSAGSQRATSSKPCLRSPSARWTDTISSSAYSAGAVRGTCGPGIAW